MERISFREAAERIRRGEVGVVPTDTLYGIVASALDRDAVERVYRVRGRDEGKPCIVLLSDMTDLGRFGIDPDDVSRSRLAEVWPGAVSVILPCSDSRWKHLHRGTGTIAFRVPEDPALHDFLVSAGPIIAPSANPSGLPPATTADEAEAYFGEDIDFLVDGGTLRNAPSTIARLEGGRWTVLRQGAIHVD
ncbi:MAG: threonylcarbamoyl-AMP synthase [Candidatus Moranbacteria bacterium]|nr:threonylcarbamoyl-AMP synthase [Candidatus Moranbacteria bacterium]